MTHLGLSHTFFFEDNTSKYRKLKHQQDLSNVVKEDGMENLLKCGFKRITYLSLSANNIQNEGIDCLSKCNYRNLTYLDLR